MRKYISLIMFLLMFTIYFKDGSIVKYDWAEFLTEESRGGKIFYILSEYSWGACKMVTIPAESILKMEKVDK